MWSLKCEKFSTTNEIIHKLVAIKPLNKTPTVPNTHTKSPLNLARVTLYLTLTSCHVPTNNGTWKNHSKYYIVPYSPLEGSVVSHGYDNTGGRGTPGRGGRARGGSRLPARGGGEGGSHTHPPAAASFCSTIVLLTFISATRKFNKSIESRILFIS